MTDDFQITGADDFLRLSKALKAAGNVELRKGLTKGLREGAKPLIPLTRAAARAQLPSRGGLADLIAKAPQRVQVRTGGRPGVRLVVGKNKGGARGADQGLIRHPVFGNRGVWVEQRVTPEWFSGTARDNADAVLPALQQAIQDVVEEVVRRG
jgi:hypothetical protein